MAETPPPPPRSPATARRGVNIATNLSDRDPMRSPVLAKRLNPMSRSQSPLPASTPTADGSPPPIPPKSASMRSHSHRQYNNSPLSSMKLPKSPMCWQIAVECFPKVRSHATCALGPLLYVYGGASESQCNDTLIALDPLTYEYESIDWTLGDRPPPLRAHSLHGLYDRFLILFGGGNGPDYTRDLYVLDTMTWRWTKLDTKWGPLARRAHSVVVIRDQCLVFGGGNGTQALNETYALKMTKSTIETREEEWIFTWQKLETLGNPPKPRGYHTAHWVEPYMLVYGGSDGSECFADIHLLHLETWTWSQVTLPLRKPRLAHSSLVLGEFLVIMGGHDGVDYRKDLLFLNLKTWQFETMQCVGDLPAARGYHTLTQCQGQLFLVGGYDGKQVFDQVHVLSLASQSALLSRSIHLSEKQPQHQ